MPTSKTTKRQAIVGMSILITMISTLTADALPPDHPIHQVPKIVDKSAGGTVVLRSDVRSAWSFRLAKKRVVVGEPISGVIRFKNLSKESVFELSPPCQGQYVATLSVWVSRWQQNKQGEEAWSPLQQVSYLNKRRYRNAQYQYQGQPIRVKPGEVYETDVLVNIVQLESHGRSPSSAAWQVLPSFASAGRYQFYLQYVNLEDLIPFRQRDNKGQAKKTRKQTEGLVGLPAKAKVLGPFEIEVVSLRSRLLSEKLVGLLGRWKQPPRHDEQSHNPAFLLDLHTIYQMIAEIERTSDKYPELIASLWLSVFRAELARQSIIENHDRLEKMEIELNHLSTTAVNNVLKKSIDLARCEILANLGKADDAVKLAIKIDSPDAAVFVNNLARDEK